MVDEVERKFLHTSGFPENKTKIKMKIKHDKNSCRNGCIAAAKV